ncbi:tRNA (adenosine(37)-N6)-dimethylallyltransferase MiaA [Maribacter sp. X9]|uniref:tRNA (adenosine(37)-N6)-dimethylallyltransferase MiaA n=1 Tax=Maribacter sp. X9 TaxID=3402159 RepID=UPI003AF356A6
MNKLLISVIGPTAIGKTKLAILLARHFKTEIISADSRQFYKEMRIGTAVPRPDELNQATHHFIQHKSVTESYSVGDFEREAIEKIRNLFKTKNIVVMVGGSGLYVNAVTEGLNAFPTIDASVRTKLNSELEAHGLDYLQDRLKKMDSTYYDKVDIHNPQRVIRALEVCIGSGQPYSSFIAKPTSKRNFEVVTVGLKADRSIIYNRINQRVDLMLQEGLVEEALAVVPFRTTNALQTVGYKELFKHFDGEWTMDFAIAEIKKNTRRFAKRQLTWFLKNEKAIWFNYDDDEETIIQSIEKEIKKTSNA